jgi:hypothetical protein
MGVLPIAALEDSRRFVEEGARRWKALVESAQLNPDPFGLFAERRPPRGMPRLLTRDGDSTLFHTGYVWLGGAARRSRSVWTRGRPTPATPRSRSASIASRRDNLTT